MMKKGIIFGALLLLSTSSIAGMTICNKYACQPSKKYDSAEILDALGQVFSGKQKELVLCEADPYTKTCLGDTPIVFSGQTNWMSVQFQIPFIRILQVQPSNDSLQLLLDYQIQANQYYPSCKPANSTLSFSVSDQEDYLLDSPDFNCQMTELGETNVKMHFTVDYMNLDKGYLGASYHSMVKGDVLGGGTGYVLMKISDQRSIELPRPIPTDFVSEKGYHLDTASSRSYQGYPGQEPKLVDWDWDNIKEKWNNFKTKFLKILYLEPLDD